jgi:Hypothetical glycosyl hydrolase 6
VNASPRSGPAAINRRTFLKHSLLTATTGALANGMVLGQPGADCAAAEPSAPSKPSAHPAPLPSSTLRWIRTARVFLIDAYQPPFAPKLEYDAEALARTMSEMHANTVRFATMGKYATIQGVRFSTCPGLGKRDLLTETITAAKPRGIRVVPYISTGHKLAWSMVTRDYPEYAQRTRPGGGPSRSHMYVGEDHGTVCWNTPYRAAYLDLVEHVVRDYEVQGLYFDTWRPFYFWPGLQLCYCDGCRNGFRKASGKEIPWHEKESDYTRAELETIAEYHHWYKEELIGILQHVRRMVKSRKDIPLIYNVNDPEKLAHEDPRILAAMDAFLYERGRTLLERAEGVSLARAAGLGVWPYVGGYNNWPRVIRDGLDYQQEIFATAAFGGAPIIAQPYAYVAQPEARRWVAFPFSVLEGHEQELAGFENVPYAAVVWAKEDPPGHAQSGWFWKADVRSSTLGAFAACLYGHVQVSSVPESLLDRPERLAAYRVLYLADVPHLTPQRVAHIQQFVENGGGLLASYATSLYGAKGERLERFGLEELLQVRPVRPQGELAATLKSYQCMLGGPNDLYLLHRNAPRSALVPLWFFEPVEALEGGSTVMDIVTGDGWRPILPGVVASKRGKGRVIYLASSLESLYSSTRQSVFGQLLRGLVEEAAGAPPPVRLKAPTSLIANLTSDGKRWVLHLLNWSTDPENEGGYLPAIENVSVRVAIPEGKRVRRVSSFLEAPLKQRQTGRELELRLARIEAYQAIVIELS